MTSIQPTGIVQISPAFRVFVWVCNYFRAIVSRVQVPECTAKVTIRQSVTQRIARCHLEPHSLQVAETVLSQYTWLYTGLARFPDPACSEKVPESGCPAPFPVPNPDKHQYVPLSIILLRPLYKWNQIAYSLLGLRFLLSTIPFEIRSSRCMYH